MRKILASLVVLVMVLSVMTLTAMAAGAPQIVVEQVTAQAGESVDVDVSLKNNPGINTFTLSIEYDKDRLQLTGLTMNAGLGGSHNFSANTEAVTWLASADTSYNGVAFTLHFNVLEDANAGNAEVTVTYSAGGICNYDEYDVNFTVLAGGVNITCSHSFDEVSTHAATCDKDGNNALYICNLCNKVFKADGVTETTMEAEKIPALGHDMATATCTKPATCKRKDCGYTDGEPLGHDYKAEWVKDEAGHWHICGVCTAPSQVEAHAPGTEATEYTDQICTVCGYVITPALGHTHATTKVEGFAATCTEPGQKAYYTCPCGKWFEDATATVEIADHASVAIAALGHDMSAATCIEAALCQREGCDYTEGEALGHNWIEATCLAPMHCDRCDMTEGEVLPHTEGEWQLDSKDHWKNCTICGIELSENSQPHADADTDGICDICILAIPVQDPENPATGDFNNLWLMAGFTVVCFALCIVLLMNKKRING